MSNNSSCGLLPGVCLGSQFNDSVVAKCPKINGKVHPEVIVY